MLACVSHRLMSMSNTLKLLERVRERTETKSNYAVYSALSVQAGVFKRWIEGTGYPGNAAAFKIAEILEMDAKAIIALIEEDKAESKEARAYWRSLCPESVREALAGATAAALIIGGVFAGFSPSPALAHVPADVSAIHIMSSFNYRCCDTHISESA